MTRWLAACVLFITLAMTRPTNAQVIFAPFHQTAQIGRGNVIDAHWNLGGNRILVNTVTGMWLYSDTFTDIAHLPDVRLARFGGPNQSFMAGLNTANEVMVWDWDDRTLSEMGRYPGSTAYVTALEWSPDGDRIATLDQTGRILVWNLTIQGLEFEARLNGATQIAWSKRGSYLAAINAGTQAFVVWDNAGKQMMQEKPAYTSQSGSLEWRDDTQLLQILYEEGQTGRLWDVSAGKPLWDKERSLGYFSAYSPDGSKIAVSSVDLAFIEDAETGETLSLINRPQWAEIAWSPDGNYVAFGDRTIPRTKSARVYIVNANTGAVVKELYSQNTDIRQLYWTPDGKRLLTVYGTQEMSIASTDPQISTYSVFGSFTHTDIGTTLDWNTDGTQIVAANTTDGAILWDAETGDRIAFRMNMTGDPATRIAWQPGGTRVATTSDDGWTGNFHNVYIWDAANPSPDMKPIAVIPHVYNVRGFAWSPDGTSLMTAESSWFLHLWKPENPNNVQTLDIRSMIGDGSGIAGVTWSDNGDIVVVPNSGWTDGAVALIDVASETLLPDHTRQPLSDGIHGLLAWAWTPANQFVGMQWGSFTAGGAYDFRVQVLYDPASDVPEGEILLSGLAKPAAKAIFSPHADKVIGFDVANNAIIWESESQKILARLSGVTNAVWSPDETMLVTYGADGLLRVVNANTGETIDTFANHFNTYPPISVFWSPDSRKIALLDRGALFIYEKNG